MLSPAAGMFNGRELTPIGMSPAGWQSPGTEAVVPPACCWGPVHVTEPHALQVRDLAAPLVAEFLSNAHASVYQAVCRASVLLGFKPALTPSVTSCCSTSRDNTIVTAIGRGRDKVRT